MQLAGKFATLRELIPEDAEMTFRWRHCQRAHSLNKGASTIEQQRQWILARKNYEELNFIIQYKDIPVGMIALQDISKMHKSAMTGRFLIAEQAIVGSAPVAFETELLLLDYAFDVLKLHKIYGLVREDNMGVLRLRSYLGYHQDGVLRDHYFMDGKYINAVAFSLLVNEYRKLCRPKMESMIKGFASYVEKK